MKSTQSDSGNLDTRFSQGAVGHFTVTAFPTRAGNLGRHGHGCKPTDKFAPLDIVRHHFLPSFVIHIFLSGIFVCLAKTAALPLRCYWTNFVASKVEEL